MSWFGPKKAKVAVALNLDRPHESVPAGQIHYAIGDVHGRLDLLRGLLKKIEADAVLSPTKSIHLIFLGDYIDRGADARGVIDLLTILKRDGEDQVTALKGNHEEALLSFLDDPSGGPAWSQHGGGETLRSYGVKPPRDPADEAGWSEARDAFAAALPAPHLAFLQSLQLFSRAGDYVFVHAGVRPGVPMADQDEHDLLWIRRSFMDAPRAFDNEIVVHGHTPGAEPALGPGRIGVDTGAYATGVLTAARLEADRLSFIQTDA